MLGALLTPALFTGSGEGQIRSGSVTRTELEDDPCAGTSGGRPAARPGWEWLGSDHRVHATKVDPLRRAVAEHRD